MDVDGRSDFLRRLHCDLHLERPADLSLVPQTERQGAWTNHPEQDRKWPSAELKDRIDDNRRNRFPSHAD